jgi:hypothetical protein
MQLTSRDKTLSIHISAPGAGFVVRLEGHDWIFDRKGRISGSVPSRGHLPVTNPRACPGCAEFVKSG